MSTLVNMNLASLVCINGWRFPLLSLVEVCERDIVLLFLFSFSFWFLFTNLSRKCNYSLYFASLYMFFFFLCFLVFPLFCLSYYLFWFIFLLDLPSFVFIWDAGSPHTDGPPPKIYDTSWIAQTDSHLSWHPPHHHKHPFTPLLVILSSSSSSSSSCNEICGEEKLIKNIEFLKV